MKKLFFALLAMVSVNALQAALHVNMYSTPVTVTGSTTTAKYHYIDADNNGIDDCYFKIEYEFSTYEIVFHEVNSQDFQSEYLSNLPGWEAIAYNCSSNFGAGIGWTYDDVILAQQNNDVQFDGKGPRYLPVRKRISYTPYYEYIYGWIKVECALDASSFTVYGFAYNDVVVIEENYSIKAGQGECFGATAIDAPALPAAAVFACNGTLKVNFPQPLQLRLFDVTGKLVTEYQSTGGSEEFDLPGNAGLYFMHVTGAIKPKTIKVVL